MDLKRERALRVVASLEQRTVERGCTPAEEQQARAKAAEIRRRYAIGAAEQLPAGDDLLDIAIEYQGPTFDDLLSSIILEAEARAFGLKVKRPRRRSRRVRVFSFRVGSIIALASLLSCGGDPAVVRSGFVCSCEQRAEVAAYVERGQTSGISDDSDYYLDHLFAIAVVTTCEHLDSVPVNNWRDRLGGRSCELWFPDHEPIRP